MQAFVPLRGRAKVAVGGLFFIGVVHAVAAFASGWLLLLMNKLQAGEAVSPDSVRGVTNLVEHLDKAYWIGLVVAAITFIAWFHRAYANLPALGTTLGGFSPGAAIYSWFIPFVNLVRPYAIAKEIWIGSARSDGEDASAGSGILGLWWAAWIVSGFIGTLMLNNMGSPTNFDDLMSLQYWSIAVNGLRVIAAVIAMIAVKKITDRQMSALPSAQKLAEKPTPSSK